MVNSIRESIQQINMRMGNAREGSQILTFVTTGSDTVSENTIVANLAMMYGNSEKKVVIVDADFSKEIFPSVFKQKSLAGLSDYLMGEKISIKDVVNHYGQNIAFVSSGKVVMENTRYLLGEPKLKKLFEELLEQYDLILVNTDVFKNYSTLQPLLDITQQILLVFELAFTKKKQLKKMIDDMGDNKQKILGYINAQR